MTTSGTSADTTDHALKVDCHQCHTRYRVRHSNRLTSSARSTCPTCGARFAVVSVRPTLSRPEPFADMMPATSDYPRLMSLGATDAVHSSRPCSFHGTGGTLFGMHIINICLSIATLGAYHFWGKAKIRRYLSSAKLHSLLIGLPTTVPERSSIKDFSKRCWCSASHIFH